MKFKKVYSFIPLRSLFSKLFFIKKPFKHLRLKRAFALALMYNICAASAQFVNFNSFTTENGLSHNAVLSVAQDKKGFIWLGTGYGLNRYDGKNFKIYTTDYQNPHSLGNNYITALLCDRNGHLWIGGGDGLQLYNEQKDDFNKVVIPGMKPHTSSDIISALYEDKDGTIWIGTFNGLFISDKNNHKSGHVFAYSNKLAGTNIRTVFRDNQSNLWIGTASGLTKIAERNGQQYFQTFRHDKNNPASLPGDFVTSLAQDPDGNIWIGTENNGVCIYNARNGLFDAVKSINSNEHIRKINVRKNGDVWIGTQDGLLVYAHADKTTTRYTHDITIQGSLSQNSIFSIYSDKTDNMWVGTYFGGVNLYNNYNTPFFDFSSYYHVTDQLFNDVVSGIAQDKNNNLWIGTEGGGVHKVNLSTGKFVTFTNKRSATGSLGSNNVKTVYCDKDGNIWIGTHAGGLNVYNEKDNSFGHYLYNPNNPESSFMEVSSLADDDLGNLWVGTHSGLYIFKRNGKQLTAAAFDTAAGLNKKYIRTLTKDSRGNIWIGTSAGLYLFTKDSRTFSKISSVAANSIAESADGNIWIAANNAGLAEYDYTARRFLQIADMPSFGKRNIIGILADRNGSNIWLSTDKGIIEYNTRSRSQRVFTRRDGLASENFNYNSYTVLDNNEMLLGGIGGITVFHPDKIETNKNASPVFFTELKLLDSILPVGNKDNDILKNNILNTKSVHLKYNQNNFSVGYALLNFIRSSKNRYAYKLDGFNQNWIQTPATAAAFTDVPPGRYTFEVKGANNDGIWSKPVKLSVTIAPPFWRSLWAYLIYICAAVALIFVIIRYFFLREILKKEEALHLNKLNFFTNISHEIRTHLTLITTPLEQVIHRNNLEMQDALQIKRVQKNSSRLLTLVSELMDFRKAESGSLKLYIAQYNIVDILEEITAAFEEVAQERNISLQIIYNNPDIPLFFDRNQMTKVFFNLVGNAFKYTPSGGKICIHTEETDKDVSIRVTDNGMGIKEESLQNIFNNFYQAAGSDETQNTGYGIGLATCKSIVELHKGAIGAESIAAGDKSEGKTIFNVTLPKGVEHFTNLSYIVFKKDIETPPQIIRTEQENTVAPNTVQTASAQLPVVLLVEDNPELRELLRNTLCNSYQILEAVDGTEGINTAVREIPDIIISDVMMPKTDGFTLCNTLKKDERTSHIPIVLLTAKSTQTDHINGLEHGADIYLTKPFSTQVLQLTVRNLLYSKEQIRRSVYERITSPAVVPEQNILPSLSTVDDAFLSELTRIVDDNMAKEGFGVTLLSRKIGMSPPILYKKLSAVTGLTVNDFIKTHKMKKAAQLLLEQSSDIAETAEAVGFKYTKYFVSEFKKAFGMSPKAYKDKHNNILS